MSSKKPQTVFSLSRDNDTQWHELNIRPIERGELRDLFAVHQVWTVYEDKAVEELLVIRKEKMASAAIPYAMLHRIRLCLNLRGGNVKDVL